MLVDGHGAKPGVQRIVSKALQGSDIARIDHQRIQRTVLLVQKFRKAQVIDFTRARVVHRVVQVGRAGIPGQLPTQPVQLALVSGHQQEPGPVCGTRRCERLADAAGGPADEHQAALKTARVHAVIAKLQVQDE